MKSFNAVLPFTGTTRTSPISIGPPLCCRYFRRLVALLAAVSRLP
jgi:hypothetical protein